MIGTGLKNFALEYGLNVSKGAAYGDLNGYTVTMFEGMGTKTLCISVQFTDEDKKNSLYVELNDPSLRKQYKLSFIQFGEKEITVVFIDTIGTMKRLRSFVDFIVLRLNEKGALGAEYCIKCAQPLNYYDKVYKRINGVVYKFHETCVDDVIMQADKQNKEYETVKKNYGKGILGASLGALVGAIPWAIAYYFGWFVGWLGFVIGIAAKKGYELMGGKPGKAKLWIVIVCTFLGVIVGQIVSDAFAIGHMISSGEIAWATYADIPYILVELFKDSAEYMRSTLGNIGIGFIFAFLGLIGILKEIREENKKNKTDILDLN